MKWTIAPVCPICQVNGVQAMSDSERNPNQQKNRFIFAGTGAVLGAVAGFGAAGVIAALGGATLGGLLGYHLLTRIGPRPS